MEPEVTQQTQEELSKAASPSFSRLDLVLADKPLQRREIFDLLRTREWFKATSDELQLTLANLPHEPKVNHDGFLLDLAKRPDTVSNVTHLNLARLERGNFGLIAVFNVANDQGTKFTYEYFSWRYGPESGAKGLVLIESDGKPTHFIVLRGEKFATGRAEMDSVGGFIDINIDGVTKALDRVKREVQEELGLPDVRLAREPIILGSQATDPGMTNNRPLLFVASIDASEAEKIAPTPRNPDQFELKTGAAIFPISELRRVVLGEIDSYFGLSVLKAWAMGILDLDSSPID